MEPMSDNGTPATAERPGKPEGSKPRQTRSYQTELMQLQSKVTTALLLLKSVKPEKGSADTMAAVIGLLQG